MQLINLTPHAVAIHTIGIEAILPQPFRVQYKVASKRFPEVLPATLPETVAR